MAEIGLNGLKEKYNRGLGYWQIVTCRPEINKFRLLGRNTVFTDCPELHKAIKDIMKLKDKVNQSPYATSRKVG